MRQTAKYRAGLIGVCFILVGTGGCSVGRLFSSRPSAADGPPAAAALPPPGRGYLSPGSTFDSVQTLHESQETAIERAIHLQIENDQIRKAITGRDRQIDELRRRLESKEQLLNRIESEVEQSIEEVESASQRFQLWNDELTKLHARARGETDASTAALETLSKRVEALTRQQTTATATSLEKPAAEPVHELPEPAPEHDGMTQDNFGN